jgi:hypothetical protein
MTIPIERDRATEGAIPVSVPTHSNSPIWPKVVIGIGLGFTVAWTLLLVFGVAKLVELVILINW